MADHLIDEVDEALRRERIEAFWKKFGQYVVVASVGILILTVGVVIWQSHRSSQHTEWTSQLIATSSELDSNRQSEEAIMLAENLAASSDGGASALSHLWLAQLHMENGNPEKARDVLAELPPDTAYGDFAALLSQSIRGGTEPEAQPDVFRFTAMELEASAHLAEGRESEAAVLLKAIRDDALSPQSMRMRAQLLLDHIGQHQHGEVEASADMLTEP